MIMSKPKKSKDKSAKDGARVHWLARFWRGVVKFFKDRGFGDYVSENSLRYTANGDVQLDMKHFLARDDVKERIKEARAMSIALGLRRASPRFRRGKNSQRGAKK